MSENTEISTNCNHNKVGFLGLLITLGIVFGDIGTSPLYVMKAILHTGETIDESTILGALSCIIWTLTLQTTIKYVCVALRADNNGEGGILALYALLRRLKSKWIYILAIIGASTLLADGIITPAITVTTAIEGLESISPNLPVIPITLGIITIIFFVQRFGTECIGKSFGVFMLLWFLLLGMVGIISITYCPLILKAFNPYYAVILLAKSPQWFLILGAVFLCTTGAEALYSDLGHCGRKNITISWAFVKTMLILNYLGQGAWVLTHAQTASSVNPFFSIMPQSMLFFAIIMATGAAIVASQALISGTFSILSEAMNLHFWPRMRIKHSTYVKGQIYIPTINLAMYRCGSHHPAVSRLLAYGGCLRTCHHHHHADDHIAAWRLPAHKGCIAIHHDTVYWRILHHRGGVSCSQSVKVSRRRMVYDAYWLYIVPDDVCVGSCHKDTPPLHQRQTAGRLLSNHLRHQSRWEHP